MPGSMVLPAEHQDLVSQFLAGLGELPEGLLTEDNRLLHEQLLAKQGQVKQLQEDSGTTAEDVVRLSSHLESVSQTTSDAKLYLRARQSELLTEKGLECTGRLLRERCTKDISAQNKTADKLDKEVLGLSERLESRNLMVDLLDEERAKDESALHEWTQNVDKYEENILDLLRLQHEDAGKVKGLHLKLSRLRESVDKAKVSLDEAATDNAMAQRALDKVAEEFRLLHAERQEVMAQWQESNELAKKRDTELTQLYAKVSVSLSRVEKARCELRQQETFLRNEKVNLADLQRQIGDTERNAQTLANQVESAETELDDVDSELVLEERETAKFGATVSSKRSRLKEVKEGLKQLQKKLDTLKSAVSEAEKKKKTLASEAGNAEWALKELERLLETEEKRRDLVQWDLDRLREKKLKKEQALHQLAKEEDLAMTRVKGLRMERTQLLKRLRTEKSLLVKKEDLSVANDFKIAELERQIRILKGALSPENRAELKRELDQAKEELQSRLAEKRNLDHMQHKIEADVRKIYREIAKLESEEARLVSKLEEVTLSYELSKKLHEKRQQDEETLMLEEKLLMVNEKKVQQELKSLSEAVLELSEQAMNNEEGVRKQRSELEAQKELLIAQERHLRDDLRVLKTEVRERKQASEQHEIRYNHLVRTLGAEQEVSGDSSKSTPSHAFHVVKLAQEKAELQDQAEYLTQRLEIELRELHGLQDALAQMTQSNGRYRSSQFSQHHDINCDSEQASEAVRAAREKVRAKERQLDELRSQIVAKDSEIRLIEEKLRLLQQDTEQIQSCYEERSDLLHQLQKDTKTQEKRLERAQRLNANASTQLATTAPNAPTYELDLQLRAAKESQRATLLKLRELSLAEPKLALACRDGLEQIVEALGLQVPTLTRLERMSYSSSAGSQHRSSARMNRSRSISRLNTPSLSGLKDTPTSSSLYRLRRSSSSSGSLHPKQSFLVMELSQIGPGQASTGCQLPAVN